MPFALCTISSTRENASVCIANLIFLIEDVLLLSHCFWRLLRNGIRGVAINLFKIIKFVNMYAKKVYVAKRCRLFVIRKRGKERINNESNPTSIDRIEKILFFLSLSFYSPSNMLSGPQIRMQVTLPSIESSFTSAIPKVPGLRYRCQLWFKEYKSINFIELKSSLNIFFQSPRASLTLYILNKIEPTFLDDGKLLLQKS